MTTHSQASSLPEPSQDPSADPGPIAPPADAQTADAQTGFWQRFQQQRAHRGRQDAIFLSVAGAWVAFDQLTKVILRDSLAEGQHDRLTSFFRFSHFENNGAAFGLFGDANAILAVSAIVAIVVLGAYYLFPVVDHWAARLGLALILGGAVGNLLDRIYQGSVTDFINFNEFPAFNVADAGINIGVFLILIVLVVRDATRSASHR